MSDGSGTLRAAATALKFAAFALVFLLCALAFRAAVHRAKLRGEIPASSGTERIIVIDPGHGGKDGGASGVSGTLEKDLNFDIAFRLAELASWCGENVKLTRTGDDMLSLEGTTGNTKGRDIRSRIKIADETPGALLVSIHMNSFPDAKYKGLQVFYPAGDAVGALTAESIRRTCVGYLQPDNARKTKEAPQAIYLLNHIGTPAVLVECGFISNPEEDALLGTPSYRSAIAAVICEGLLNSFE